MHVLTTYQGLKSQPEPKFWFLIEMIVFRFCLNVSTYGSNNWLEVEDETLYVQSGIRVSVIYRNDVFWAFCPARYKISNHATYINFFPEAS